MASSNIVGGKDGRGSDETEMIHVRCGGSEEKEAGEVPAGGLKGLTVDGGFVGKGDRCSKAGGGQFGLVGPR